MKEMKFVIFGVVALLLVVLSFGSFYVIDPGERGIVVTLGKVSSHFSAEGLGFKMPLLSSVTRVSIRQQTKELTADAFSQDLQQVRVNLAVLYKIPEASVVSMFQQYSGSPFETLIAPRVQEALKEATALESAEGLAKGREKVKVKVLELARQKIGNILFLEDIVIQDIALSKELEQAIEAKMVQEQEAAKAKFIQQKAEIEAKTAVIKAEGEAKAMSIRGNALRSNPSVVDLMIAEKWNGVSPLVVGGNGSNSNILLPIGTKGK